MPGRLPLLPSRPHGGPSSRPLLSQSRSRLASHFFSFLPTLSLLTHPSAILLSHTLPPFPNYAPLQPAPSRGQPCQHATQKGDLLIAPETPAAFVLQARAHNKGERGLPHARTHTQTHSSRLTLPSFLLPDEERRGKRRKGDSFPSLLSRFLPTSPYCLLLPLPHSPQSPAHCNRRFLPQLRQHVAGGPLLSSSSSSSSSFFRPSFFFPAA